MHDITVGFSEMGHAYRRTACRSVFMSSFHMHALLKQSCRIIELIDNSSVSD